jgi:hypothetical protein
MPSDIEIAQSTPMLPITVEIAVAAPTETPALASAVNAALAISAAKPVAGNMGIPILAVKYPDA